jgi:peroxiredoxin
MVLTLFIALNTAQAASLPEKGRTLPAFKLSTPSLPEDVQYLGLKGETFELKDVECRVLLVEIIGVYCPHCYQQAPLFNQLYGRIAKRNLNDKVKMLGIAVGATATEVDHLRKNGQYQYPVTRDSAYVVHKLLGEPKTPFTLLIDRGGKIIYTHQGVQEDIDGLFQIIQDSVK